LTVLEAGLWSTASTVDLRNVIVDFDALGCIIRAVLSLLGGGTIRIQRRA
jgi:uncharacterized membrane protein YeiH